MLHVGSTVRITEELEQAFRMNGWNSYDPNTHGKIEGKTGTVTKIEPKYAHDFCYVDVHGVGAFSEFTLPIRSLTVIELPSDNMCELIAEFTNAHPTGDVNAEKVKEWFNDKLIDKATA